MGDSEEIVMTAAKRNNTAIIRLNRTSQGEMDKDKVHHVGGGPYKGIIINKASTGLADVEPAESRQEFMAYLAKGDNTDEAIRDYWTIAFWFRGTEDRLVKKDAQMGYFKELLDPNDFPKDYISFIKKALVLLMSYSVIKRVELQVQHTEDSATHKQQTEKTTPQSQQTMDPAQQLQQTKDTAVQLQQIEVTALQQQLNEDSAAELRLTDDSAQQLQQTKDTAAQLQQTENTALQLQLNEDSAAELRLTDDYAQQLSQNEDPAPPDFIPPIRGYTTVFTPALNSYRTVSEVSIKNKSFLTFMVKAACDVHIALCSTYGDVKHGAYEIVIGADDNTKCYIRENANGMVKAESTTINVLSDKESRYFWINWTDHQLEVGRGAQYGNGRLLQCNIPTDRQFKNNCLAVRTSKETTGHWKFAELLDDFKEEDPDAEAERIAKRTKIRLRYMWFARKYRMLHYLEDVFPNVLTVDNLVSHCKIKYSDLITVAVQLGDLQSKGLIHEVVKGHWMRKHNGSTSHQENEMKVVKVMPQLSRSQQPTVAIITSLYCEKLAVDAMIQEKQTFVKCKTEGESQVYTIGQIGKHRVVSTKLPCIPGNVEASNIAAGNSVTRLLGTFNKVEHVLIVGVGGGVRIYDSGHMTFGDIVVSMPSNGTNAMYAKQYKLKGAGSGDCKYTTRTWHSHEDTLRLMVGNISDQILVIDQYIRQAMIILSMNDSKFLKPGTTSSFNISPDKAENSENNAEECTGPETQVFTGAIGSISTLEENDNLKMSFAKSNGIRAYDRDIEPVLESLDGNRNESYLIIRGVADFDFGSSKDWQPYASITAAAYMKTLILGLN